MSAMGSYMSREERESLRIELGQEAAQETCKKRLKNMMRDHKVFAEFVANSVGEEWMTEILAAMTEGGLTSSPVADAFRDYCETCRRENG